MLQIENETDLRHWLRDNIGPKISIQWIEPSKYGSSIGQPDCTISYGTTKISLELKVWDLTRNGIRCKMRPVQRRWHHVNNRNGTLTAVLAYVKDQYIILVRGDHVPLRDYASDPNSGCKGGHLIYRIIYYDYDDDYLSYYNKKLNLKNCLFNNEHNFWDNYGEL